MALVMTLMTMTLLVALGTALSMLAGMEMRISGNYRAGAEAMYAAEAAVEVALDELRAVPDWSAVLDGSFPSRLVFGASSGRHHTAAGPIDLTEATANPGWRLYARGDLRDFVRLEGVEANSYVIVWVAPALIPGTDALAVQAHAHGPGGVRRAVEVRVAREGPLPGLRVFSWREAR